MLGVILVVAGCSSRSAPAPVIEVYQGKNYQDFDRAAFNGNIYKVQKGDTLFSIAWYTGNDYRDIARINNITKPYSIYPGQELRVSENANIAKSSAGRTTQKTSKTPVDPPKKQAYGESENFVNNQSVSRPKPAKTKGFPARVEKWTWPSNGKVIATFSSREQGNKGIDFAGTKGQAVKAAADGKVVYTGSALRGYGQLVIIKHSDSFLSAYAHNDRILVSEQSWVKAGQTIAHMGSSGTDTVKLHFEVRYKGKSVDPLRYLPKR